MNALAKFGAHVDELLPNILVLLQRCMLDSDDEVRDRATYYYHVLKEHQKAFNSQYILNSEYRIGFRYPLTSPQVFLHAVPSTGLQVSIIGLEKALHAYTMDPSDVPFDIKSVPLATQPITGEDHKPSKSSGH